MISARRNMENLETEEQWKERIKRDGIEPGRTKTIYNISQAKTIYFECKCCGTKFGMPIYDTSGLIQGEDIEAYHECSTTMTGKATMIGWSSI